MRSLTSLLRWPLSSSLILSLLFTLSSCGGSEARQEAYLSRANQLFSGNSLEKARIEVKNALQINANNAEARFLLAEIEESDQNWAQVYVNLVAAVDADPKMTKAHIKLAQLFIASGQHEEAFSQTGKVLSYEPDNLDAMALRAAVLARMEREDEAIGLAKQVLNTDPGHTTAIGVLANIFIDRNLTEAENVLREGISRTSDSVALQLLLIKVLEKSGRIDEIVETYNNLIRNNPDALFYPVQLTSYYVKSNRLDDAEKLLRDLVRKFPEKSEVKLMLADFLGRHRSPEQARDALIQFLNSDPNNYMLRSALASFYLGIKDTDSAIATWQYTIDRDPNSAEAIDARNRVIEVKLAQNRRSDAEYLLSDVFKLEPENAEALLIRARLSLDDGDFDTVIADARTVLRHDPGSSLALSLLAQAQERAGASDLALDSYQRLLELDPKSVSAVLGSSRLLIRRDRLDEAREILESAWREAKGDPELAKLLTEIYTRKQQSDLAMEVVSTLLINHQTQPLGHYLVGLIESRRGQASKAIDALEKSLEKEPRAIEPLQLLISILVLENQTDKAIHYLETHIKSHPNQMHAEELLASLYRRGGRLTDAEQLLTRLLQEHPNRPSIYTILAGVYVDQNRQAEIEELYLRGLDIQPGNPLLTVALAEFYQNQGKNRQALSLYEELQQKLPNSALVKNNLALLLIEKFPSEENLRRAQKLTSGFDDSPTPAFVDTLGWLHYKLGNYPQAVALLEDAIRKGGRAPEFYYHLGMAYLKSAQPDKAKKHLEIALSEPGEFFGRSEAEQMLQKL